MDSEAINGIRVSVILSVYNVAPFLRQCLDSVIGQTIRETEIICVDDASTDDSLAILREYAAKDARITVIQQEHGGAGAARNRGLEAASGEYLSILDADDFFEPDMLEKAYAEAKRQDADIVVFRVNEYDHQAGQFRPNNWSIMPERLPHNPFSPREIPDRIFNIGCGWAWDKLFRRRMVEDNRIRFQEIRTTNDLFFVYYAYACADKVSVLPNVLAHQRVNAHASLSSTREKSWNNVFLALKALKDRLEAEGKYELYRQSLVNWSLNLLLWHILTLKKPARDQLKEKCREEYFAALNITGNTEQYFYNREEYRHMSDIMEGSVKVSVVVPVYNGSAYLRQCLDSICSQTLHNIEIILVDDGSTDDTPDILNEYKERDLRVTVLTKEHSNAGDARNLGLEQATGEYLSFLDADDFFEPFMLERTYQHAAGENADVCLFRSNQFDHNSGEYRDTPWTLRDWEMPPQRPFSAQDAKDKIFNMSSCTAWDKLFRRAFIQEKKIRFQSNATSNDMLFTYSAMALAERISTLQDVLAHMRVGHPKALALDIEYVTSCYYKALYALKNDLIDRGIYGEFKKSFINWAIDFSLFNLHNFRDVFQRLVRQQLKRSYFEDLDIYGTPAEDFYVRGQYDEMMQIMSERVTRDPNVRPKVSILIPTYNVSQYLRLCMDSAVNQTLEDIEIIAINDGSTDNSLEIIQEYAAKDPRVVVITGPNGGYGKAMNKGLDRATGEYIGIIEPDDFVDVRMFEELYHIAVQKNLDLVKGDFNRFTHDEMGHMKLEYNEIAKDRRNYDVIKNPQEDQSVFTYVMNTWSGIYNRQYIETHHIRHSETPGASFQDNGFWFQTMMHATRVSFVHEPYYYNRRDNPNSSVASKAKVYCMNEEYALLRQKLDQNPELRDKFIYQFNRKRFINYLFTYDRLGEQFKQEYAAAIHKEIVEADKNEEIDWTLFNGVEYDDLRLLLSGEAEFSCREKFHILRTQVNRLQDENRTLAAEMTRVYDALNVLNAFSGKNGSALLLSGRKNRTVHIAHITDENYCMPTCVALTSMKKNKNPDSIYRIHIIASDISIRSKNKFLALESDDFTIDILDVKPDERFKNFTKKDGDLHVSPAAIIKLNLPDILGGIGKVLYLDGDILVQQDLLNLYNTNINDYYVAAVKDIISERNPRHMQFLHYPHKFYFNSGMMLLNLDRMRREGMVNKLINYRLTGINHFMDQDTLNVVLGSRTRFVSPRYNFLNKFYDWWPADRLSEFYGEQFPATAKSAYATADVLHLGSHEKPWKYRMGYLSDLYDQYYAMSPYADQPLEREDLPQ